MRTVTVTGGYTDYVVGTLTEATGKDLSTSTIKACLLVKTPSPIPPAANASAWRTPTVTYPSAGTARVSLLIGSETAPGDYWLWIDIADNPTVVPIRACDASGAPMTVRVV